MASPELALVTVLSLLFLGQVSFAETVNEQIIKVCQTFGSGVVEPFRGIPFHLSTTCPTTLLHFIHKDVEYKIIITHSLKTGLIKKAEFILNKLITVVTDGMITVEDRSVSLPYDHMYKHIHPYGIYTKLKSKILELSVMWRFAGSEIDYLWVELGESNIEEKDALCWQGGTSENVDISPSRFIYKMEGCQTRTSITSGKNCRSLSHFYECFFIENGTLPGTFPKYDSLCKANIYYSENKNTLECAFHSAIKRYCDMETYERGWKASKCPKPTCPGDLIYMEQGNPFTPTCSHPNFINSENTVETCVCPAGKVLNNFENSSRCIPKEECPCVYGGKIFAQGENRTTKCQSCTCENGAWTCIKENCQKRCIIEGGSVTTYDGKQYMLPKACTYVASQGLNWTIIIELSEDLFLGKVILQIEQKTYTFSKDSVKFENEEILELHLTEHVMVFWQSSMYVQVQTSFGMKIQVQVKPKVQLYVTLPKSESGKVKGLCGNHNDDTRDDFICRSEIRESVAEYFALSWVMGTCNSKPPGICSSDVDKYAHQDCSYLMDRSGIFASCHNEVPSEDYVKACEKIVCNCEGNKDCLCVALGNYAKACSNQGIYVGDWRNATSCVVPCNSGQMFSYDAQSCNSTCQSLAGPDPTCDVRDAPVEGCGCPHGSLLNSDGTCTTRSECQCYYLGKTLKPGNHFIGKTKCNCKDGKLDCPEPLDCSHGKTYVNCYNSSINTVNRKCASLGMPEIMSTICENGCYCPDGQYEDHNGTCVAPEDCPCLFSGVAYKSGETVTSDCQACTCKGGRWACVEEACSGNCEVFGNGHYKTFDSKWYNFDGNCEYTLVEDDCGSGHRTFSIRAESVPCCEERLTCSRRITLELQGKDTLNLHDLEVGQIGNDTQLLYSVHTVGLYFAILVPSLDITLIWDKHTRLVITLGKRWKNKVCGLCGNFNNNEQDDLQIRGSKEKTDALTSGNSWKMPVPQCSDVTEVQFNCVHFSYCANWAERRCKIISGDIFKACHQKVDYMPYYKACVEESCSCSADQASHGFCTAVAAFAEACCEAGVTVNWRTPERCPIYCDYYNKQNPQSSDATWHYKSCGPHEIKTCGKNDISRKLEGCYPTCPEDFPYFNENTKECSETCTTTTVKPTTTTESTTTVTEPPTSTTESTTVSPTTVTESTATPIVSPTTATTITTIGSTITPTITSTPSTESTTKVTEPPTTTAGSTTVSPTTVTESTATPTVTPTTATTITTIRSTITPTITSTESTTTVTEPPTTTTESTTVSPTTVTESTATPTVTPTTATTITTIRSTITPTITSTPSTESTTTVTEPPTTTTESTTVSPTSVTESTATPTTATTITTIGSTITPTITSTPSTESTTTVTEPPTTTTESTTVSPTTVTESTTTPTVTSTTTMESTTVSPTTVTESTATPTVTPTTATTITTIGSTVTQTITSTPSTESTTTVTEPPTTTTESTTVSPTTVTESTTTPTVTPTTATTVTTIVSTITPTITSTTTESATTTGVCFCRDEKNLRNWSCGHTWTENCIQYTCNDGRIYQNKVSCPPEVKPDCPNGKMRSVPTDDCCQTWECDCQCQVYGDPHYITFDGTPYDFLEDCSYILVEEKKQKHHFSVIVDNFNCVPDASCVRAVRVQYGKNIITLRIVSDRLIVSEFNNVNVPQPYENQGIRITTSNWKVSVYIDAIRSYVSLTPRRGLVVNLAMAYFHGNTQGQCGVCGGHACVRRNGHVENDTCCDKTAYSWLYEEKEKPHCKVKDVSCNAISTPAPQCDSKRVPLCELLNHKAFNECSKKVDLTLLNKNCLFDACMAKNNSVACGVLEKAASDCQNAGFCVEWRPLTNGSCDVKCPEGMIYKECPSTPTTICEGGRISTIMDKPTAGCFCPGNKHHAGRYTHTCVSHCTDCVGPHGEPKEPGDVWEANCYLCTCDKITLTQRCEPKTRSSLPTCQDNETLVRFNSTSCCNMAVCVEKTCEHRGHTYKIGERWSDSAQPCVLYSCEISGITIENKLCAEEQCLEGSRVCDKQKGCYTCKNTCSPRMSRVNVTIDGKCTDEVELPVCEGQCKSHSRWNDSELRMEKECQCCQEKTSQEKSITLKCKGGSKNTFTYKHIVDCECQICH